MEFYNKSATYTLKYFNCDGNLGLTKKARQDNLAKYGSNQITKKKSENFFQRLFQSLCEPTILILVFSFLIAFGTSLGRLIKTGKGDWAESIGILFAITLSVCITLIMEGSSKKAFTALNKIYDNITVKVLREGKVIVVQQQLVVVGDIILLESGDKIVADGRLIESISLSVDESCLTGESNSGTKDADLILDNKTALADRKNCVYSGTFVTSGSGKMIVTAVGNDTEMGKIATELTKSNKENSPLQHKLSLLGRVIAIIGTIFAIVVFVLSAIRYAAIGQLNFSTLQELFISSIVLIVAAVPEGLPTIVAVSLALNMIKLASENALIKKMIATETTGAVSVICSDKTGTLTQNKMTVLSVCTEKNSKNDKINYPPLIQNFICNSTADIVYNSDKKRYMGSATECALIDCIDYKKIGTDYTNYRKKYKLINRIPFSSQNKFMLSQILDGDINRLLIKGAPEKILKICNLDINEFEKINSQISMHQSYGRRVICFAHIENFSGDLKFLSNKLQREETVQEFIYDGYAVLHDPIRKEVKKAVEDCKKAGIKIKILTGDNSLTALAVARELKIAQDTSQVISATELEKLEEQEFINAINKVSVIARSTPIIKLRVVRALKKMGEVVAVTGDGINDAPAIKHADVGIAMGISGSEITKEAADIVLLDDSFATVVKAVSFGRSVYRNLQRFIVFQLSVNVAAMLFITMSAILGKSAPFNTIQLLWINIIMDGPPAITLGLESANDRLMTLKPVKKNQSIVSVKMLLKILFNGIFVSILVILQVEKNILKVNQNEMGGVIFTLFILFQLFNAFNSKGFGAESVFKGITKNRIMLITFSLVFIAHLLVMQFFPWLFMVNSLSFLSWIKCIAMASSIIAVSEIYKLFYRIIKSHKKLKEKI